MAYFEKTTEVTRSTWCFKDTSRVHVRLMAPGQVPPNQEAEMLLAVSWRGEVDDAQLTLRLATRDGGTGEVRFGQADGPRALSYGSKTSVYLVVRLFGVRATTGAMPDVDLIVDIDGKRHQAGRIAVQGSTRRLDIRDRATGGAPPVALRPGDEAELEAVLSAAAPGTYRWLAVHPAALRPAGPTGNDSVRVQATLPHPAHRNRRVVGVHFQPAGGGGALVALHSFAIELRGRVIDRSVVPDRAGPAADQIPMAKDTPYEIRRLDGTVAARGVLGANGEYLEHLPSGQVYELVVPDYDGLEA